MLNPRARVAQSKTSPLLEDLPFPLLDTPRVIDREAAFKGLAGWPFPESAVFGLSDNFQKDLNRAKREFKIDNSLPFIDLGCGSGREYEFMYYTLRNTGFRKYIGVELAKDEFYKHEPTILPCGLKTAFDYNPGLGRWLLQTEMLSFLTRVPCGAAHIAINSIDTCIVESDAFHVALAKQILEVLPVNGILLHSNARAVEILLKSYPRRFKPLKNLKLRDGFLVVKVK